MKNLIMTRLLVEKRKFVVAEELKELSNELHKDYTSTINYLIKKRYLVRIFKGVFYVQSLEEIKFDTLHIGHLDLVANGLKLKGITNWYFGLYTALTLNNLTHEYFAIDTVISDTLFRSKEVEIAGHKFKFIKIKTPLIFGTETENNLVFSNTEKTILDFIYIKKYRSLPENRIILDVSEYMEKANRDKLLSYVEKYPKSVRKIVEKLK
jgi:predicted transcriptional regulator of viral defense system